jgi:hypothetical protein
MFIGMVDPVAGCKQKDYLVQVGYGTETVTFRSNAQQAARLVDVINDWAEKTGTAIR